MKYIIILSTILLFSCDKLPETKCWDCHNIHYTKDSIIADEYDIGFCGTQDEYDCFRIGIEDVDTIYSVCTLKE